MNAPVKNIPLKISQIGNSLGVILPREAVSALNVQKGDTLFLTPAPGGFRLTANDPEFDRRMEIARKIMKKRRNVLRELAK
jgi:putative addiction module antidote